jgi:hypothetical protein
MLFKEYQTIYTDFILDFNRRLDKVTDNWAIIVEDHVKHGTSSEATIQDFILNLSSLKASFKRYPKDKHFEFLQPTVEDLSYKILYDIEDIRRIDRDIQEEYLSRQFIADVDELIEELEYYTWNILENNNKSKKK